MRMLRAAKFARGLSLAAAAAIIAAAGTGDALAQFSGRGQGFAPGRAAITAPQVAQPRIGTGIRGAVATPPVRQPGKIVVPPRVSDTPRPPRRPPGVTVGDNKPPRPDGRRPQRPWRPVGPAVIVGSGAATGPAIAAIPPAPPPLPPSSGGAGSPPAAGSVISLPAAAEQRFIPDEVVLEFPGNLPAQAIESIARRHRLARLDQFTLAGLNATYVRARITDRRPVATVLAGLGREAGLRAGQPNHLYEGAQTTGSASASAPLGDPAQYALAKLRLQEAHGLTRGNDVLVAVIDSAIDGAHPELHGVIAGAFDALSKKEQRPHAHGTAIAGTIAARSRLSGVAPAARILAIRAFDASGETVQANTFAILKGIDHAMRQQARVINMSFAGPADPGMRRALAAAKAAGIVLVASAGNGGAKVPPQYPASDPNVIAVSATDASDQLYELSNRGRHIAVAAPGVDILVPVPGANYDLHSGTSVAAAHVSGIAALILARRPGLDPEAVRRILQFSARDLAPAGRDEQFGAGLADAYQALLAAGSPAMAGPAAAR
jgi:subtilisin family serine protease